jgi:hypothetical protein
MKSQAKKIEVDETFMEAGTVIARDGRSFTVRYASGELVAEQATSCLVEPQIDDRVLVAVSRSEAYVLAILRRDSDAATRLAVDGDLEVRVTGGRFSVTSPIGIDLAGGQDVSIVSGEVNINAVTGNVVVDRIAFLAATLRAEVGKVKYVGEIFDSVLERVSQRVQRSFRRVEEVDQVRAGRVDYAAEKSMCLKAENAIVDAKQLVKIEGAQIHIG